MPDDQTTKATGAGTEDDSAITRRDALKLAAGAALAAHTGSLEALASGEPAAAVVQAAAAEAITPRFFTPAELSLLDELCEMILPADEHSPGARAAKVAAYVDERLAERDPAIPDYADEHRRFREGLKSIDQLSAEMHGKPFMDTPPDERFQVLKRAAADESDEEASSVSFFQTLKRWTVHAYYTSEIGLLQEMEYKGNTFLPEFVGAEQLDDK